jgi:hypothetical protein
LKGVACPYCGEEISGGSIPVWIDFFRFWWRKYSSF